MFSFLSASIYTLLSVSKSIVSFSVSISTSTRAPVLSRLLNSLSRFAPVSKKIDELFLRSNLSILDKLNSTSEYSFSLSVAPAKWIAELSIVSTFVLWIDTLFLGLANVP